MDQHKTPPGSVKPDDPWCWLIAGGNSIIAITGSGFFRCFGLFYKPIMSDFNVHYGDVSLMSGLYGGSMAFGALVPAVARKYGCRKIGIFSGLIFSLFIFIASFSTSIGAVMLFAGVIPGICSGSLTYNMYQTCNQYFIKHRSKATNMAMLGVPLGSIVLAPLLTYLIEAYTWRGAWMITSAMALNSCAAAALYRPLVRESATKETGSSSTEDRAGNVDESLSLGKDNATCREKKKAIRRGLEVMDCMLFTQPTFVLMLISAIAYFPGSVGALFLLAPFGMDQLHLTSLQASFLLTLYGAGDCVGKLVSGAVGDIKRVDRALLLSTTTLLSAIFILVITVCESYELAAAVACLQGFVTAPYHGLNSVVYADIVGLERLPIALGYHGFLNNFATLPVIYLLGLSVDRTGDVRVAYYICSGLLACTSASLFAVFFLKKRDKPRYSPSTEPEAA